MRLPWRRGWLLLVVALALLTALMVHVAVEWYTWEPPNYSQIEDGLWLGGHVEMPPPQTRAVLNLCEVEDPYRVEVHKWQRIRDGSPAPSLDWLRTQVKFIESERSAGHTVYIHCMNGASRSAMVTAAYLMKREGWKRDKALEYLRMRRPAVRPNPAFIDLLLQWETEIKR